MLWLLLAAAGSGGAKPAKDPLAGEIERWSAYLRSNTRTDENWTQVKQATQPAIDRAEEALRGGRRYFALSRLAAARVNLAAAAYVGELPADKRDDAARLEAEWARVGALLRGELGNLSPTALEGARPAAVRALGEAALLQVRGYYEASLEYGRNTMPQAGFFYLGAAQGQRDFVAFCRTVRETSPRRAPPVRSVAAEIEALETDLLAAYRPPASIDKHGDFIRASSMLKEARELDAAGLRYGALLRYLQAAQQAALLRPPAAAPGKEPVAGRLNGFARRLDLPAVDHSVGRLFLETAQAEPAAPGGDVSPVAAAIADEVLPRYFAALEPARPAPAPPAPRATVTLVRWPYT